MRDAGERFAALLTVPNDWQTKIEWSNDGFVTINEAKIESGSVTCSARSQTRWGCDLVLPFEGRGLGGWNPITTTFRVWHGLEDSLLPMGLYKATTVRGGSDSPSLSVRGESFERYLIKSRFLVDALIPAASARLRMRETIKPVLGPNYVHDWRITNDVQIPAFQSGLDRWAVIDGRQSDTTSISRALGARTYAGPYGEMITAPVPSLEDAPVWEARAGELKISDAEELDDDRLANVIVVTGENEDGAVVTRRFVMDDNPASVTYAERRPDQGGLYRWPIFYTSRLIRTDAQADLVGRSLLADRLGVQQQIEFVQMHDPRIEVGDVGLVGTDDGDRLALIDEITYDLGGGPLRTVCRTTATRLAGGAVASIDEDDYAPDPFDGSIS